MSQTNEAEEALLALNEVTKSYSADKSAIAGSSVCVLRELNFRLNRGESVALLGDSGAGKSTLLHIIAGLDKPDTGQILYNGRALHQITESQFAALRREEFGLIFQQFHLIDTLSVIDNVRFQANLLNRPDRHYEVELIERLGLTLQLSKYPAELSRGQQQRVAIARALLSRPSLLLADEPTGSLDDDASEAVIQILLELIRDSSTSLLMVTHSSKMAQFLDRRLRLDHGQLQPCD